MNFFKVIFLTVIFFGSYVGAKPVLKDSQQTYYSTCISGDLAAEKKLEFCQAALSEPTLSPGQRLDVQVEVGDALYSLDRFDEAEAIFNVVLSTAPDLIDGLNGLAWVHWSRDKYELAVDIFQKSVDLGPSSQGFAGLASSQRHLDAISASGFSELLDVAIALSPDYTWALREKGWGLNEFGLHEEAEAAFLEALKLDPKSQWTVYGLAYTYNQMDRYQDALDRLLSVETDEYTPTGFYSQLSLARFHLGDYKEAIKYAEKTIDGWPNSGTGYVRKARALNSLGQRGEAIELLRGQEAIEHNGFVAYWLADLLADEGQMAAALDALSVTFKKGEADSHDFELQAYLLLEQEEDEAAWKSVKAGLNLDPKAPYLLFYSALLMVEDGDYDASELAMAEAFENGAPDSLASDFIQALVSSGQFTRAIRWRIEARDKARGN